MRGLLGAVLVFMMAALPVIAASLEERLAPCLACHGEKGQSEQPEVPSLGAQPAFYVMVQLGHEMFERLILHGLPGTGDRKDKAPAACGSGVLPVGDQGPGGLGTLGGLTAPHHQRGPTRGHKRAHPRAQHDMCTAIPSVALGPHEPQAPWEALAGPCRPHPDEAQAHKPGLRRASASVLPHRSRGAAVGGLAAIAQERQAAVRRCWPGDHASLRHPAHEERPVPSGGVEPAAQAPGGAGGGRPPGQRCPGLAPGRDALQEDAPATYATMATAP